MRFILLCLLALPLSVFSQQAEGQFSIRKATEKDVISCPHSGHTISTENFKPSVSNFKSSNKFKKSKQVEFIPQYIDVPSTFQNTVEFVLEQLSNFVSTDVPVYVSVEYTDLGGGPGGLTLANARAGEFPINFPGAEYVNTFYPVALAEKLSGQEINPPGDPDIVIQVNSNRAANFSVTPNNPVIGTRSDLATTLIHEIIHGLGFTAGASVDVGGRGIVPFIIYSRFLEDIDGVNYIDNYPNNSIELGDELTGNRVFFNGPRFDLETRAQIHAPRSFNAGSSISHVDAVTYGDSEDRLMAPFINGGDINYNPGIAIDMLHEMGWFTTNFIHDSQRFNEDASQDYMIRAKVRTDSRVNESTVKLHYSRDTFQNEDIIVDLPKDQTAGDFFFTLPATNTFTVFQYYFEVQDDSLGIITTPITAPLSYFQYIMGADTEGPVISGHIPVTSIRETDQQFTLSVNEFTDFFTGVDTSSLAAVINFNGSLDTIPFELMADGFGEFYELDYRGQFSASDQIGYKIILLDKSINKNEGQLPLEGFYPVEVEAVNAAVVSYENNFDNVTSDFRGVGFEITQPEGFSTPAIHSEHPYQTAGTGTLDFTYELSQLILIDSVNPVISFDEIVIVEKGDAGTSCRGVVCTFEFWDYVVVEAKRKFAVEWQPLLNAYDSRDRTIWLNAYDAGEDGTPDLFRSRTIDMTANGNFSVGQEVFIRFRLFSDPAANGWGWAIDNLEIQPGMSTPTLDETVLNQFIVSPNPVSSTQDVSIDLAFSTEFSGFLTLLNNNGQRLLEKPILNRFNHSTKLDISGLSSGIYYLRLSNHEGVSTRKLVID